MPVGRRISARLWRAAIRINRKVYYVKPQLSLTVGVVGHRSNRLSASHLDKIRADIDQVLSDILDLANQRLRHQKDVFAGEAVDMVLLSALAEGADRIAAHAALKVGYKLGVFLPYFREVYESDFPLEESVRDFRNLLSRAESVLELPGTRENSARDYENVGLRILDYCDILLLVWDGGGDGGRGGTVRMANEAARRGIPIVHIDATGAKPPMLLLMSDETAFAGRARHIDDLTPFSVEDRLGALMSTLINPPPSEESAKALEQFFNEKPGGANWRPEYRVLLSLLGIGSTKTSMADEDKMIKEESPTISPVFQAFNHGDGIATHYAQMFRSAFVANFVLAAGAVLLAAFSLLAPVKWPFVLAEVGLIFLLILNTTVGRKQQWHARWVEAREVAEYLRLSANHRAFAVPHTILQRPAERWTSWLARAYLRGAAMPEGRLDQFGLRQAKQSLIAVIEDQSRHHKANAVRMKKLEHRLERLGEVFFFTTLLVAVLYLVAVMFGLKVAYDWKYLVTALTAGLPALGTAVYGIRLIGDFETISERSEQVHQNLATIVDVIHASDDPAKLRGCAQSAHEIMLSDVENWKTAVESRGLAIPG